MTVKEYVEANGYKVSELTKEELAAARREVRVINSGGVVLDGVFSGFTIDARLAKERRGN